MAATKTIVCFANSRKMTGRCVAGKEINSQQDFGKWIRPVSDRETEEISEEERRYQDGTDPKVLDIVRIQMTEPRPHNPQTENYLIDPNYYWEQRGKVDWKTIQCATDKPETLWTNGYHSYNGLNDRVPEQQAEGLDNSLFLIKPRNLTVTVAIEGGQYRKRKVRANFDYNGQKYTIAVTDPTAERTFLAMEDGEYPVEDALLCVSLGEPYQGYCYKLVATVITP